MTKINPFKWMVKGLRSERNKIVKDLAQVANYTQSFSMGLIDVKPEEPLEYNPHMPLSQVYHEVGRLDARRCFPQAAVDSQYLASSVERYKQLHLLIQDPWVKDWVADTIKGLEKSITLLKALGQTHHIK